MLEGVKAEEEEGAISRVWVDHDGGAGKIGE
jgi:hypothetical protein